MRRVVVLTSDFDQTVGELERGLDGIGKTAAIFSANDEAIDDNRDAVIQLSIELRRIRDLDQIAVDICAHKPLLPCALEQLLELAFSATDEWREDFDLCAFGPGQNRSGDLRCALALDGPSAVGAMRRSRSRVQQAEVVVDLGDGPDGRARIVTGALLFDRDPR